MEDLGYRVNYTRADAYTSINPACKCTGSNAGQEPNGASGGNGATTLTGGGITIINLGGEEGSTATNVNDEGSTGAINLSEGGISGGTTRGAIGLSEEGLEAANAVGKSFLAEAAIKQENESSDKYVAGQTVGMIYEENGNLFSLTVHDID